MKNILRVLIAGLLMGLPIAARWAWFSAGSYTPTSSVTPPDYGAVTLAELPLSTPAPQTTSTEARGKIVLIDQSHAEFRYFDLGQLVKQIYRRGAVVETIIDASSRPLTECLKYAAAYVVVAPTILFTPPDIQAIQQFVAQGGRLLALTDPGYDNPIASTVVANFLLASFDLTFVDDFLYNLTENEGNYRNVIFRSFADHALTKGLTQVVMYAARTVETASGTPLMRGEVHMQSSLTGANGALTPAALSANGQVLAVGDLTFLLPPYNQVADNAPWIERLAAFLTGGSRAHRLTDFPYVFNRPIDVALARGVQLNADNVPILSQAQALFASNNLPMSIVERPSADHDTIVLGLYSSGASLAPYLAPFGVSLPDSALNTIDHPLPLYAPGLGQIAWQNTGLILYAFTPFQSRLALLAESPARLSQLLAYLQATGLKDCIVQDAIGVCRLGEAGPAANQTYTSTASLDPATANLLIDQTTMLNVRAQSPAGVKGVAFHLEFDPAIVEVVDVDASQAGVQIGSVNLPGGAVAVNRVDNALGTIDYMIDGLAVGKATEAIVAVITIRGKAAGVTRIDFRGVSSLPDGVRIKDANDQVVAAEGQGSAVTVTSGP